MDTNDNKLLVWRESIANQRHFNEIKNSILKNFLYFCTIIVASFVLFFKFFSFGKSSSFGGFVILGFKSDYVFVFLNSFILIASAFLHKYMNYSKMLTAVSNYLIYVESGLKEIKLSTAISQSVPSKGFAHIFNPISIFIFILIFSTIIYGFYFKNYGVYSLIILFISSLYFIFFIFMLFVDSILLRAKNKINKHFANDLKFILLRNIKEKDFSMNNFEDGIKVWFVNNGIYNIKVQNSYLKFVLINLEKRGDIVFDNCLWFKDMRSYFLLKNFKIIDKNKY